MPRHPTELARKHYEKLPQPLKEALFSADVAEKIFEIGKKFGLTIEKTGIMAEETGYVMLGLCRPNELVGNLAGGLGVDKDKAMDIATEISHQIFFPLREELKRTHDFDMDASEMAGPADISRVSGAQMPVNIKKTFVEQKSSLVGNLTRILEQNSGPTPAPSFPKTPAPLVQKSGVSPEPKPLITQPKELPEIPRSFTKEKIVEPPTVSTVEPWEKDMEKEVTTLLTPKTPLVVPPLQKPTTALPPSSIQTRPTEQSSARMTWPDGFGRAKLPPIDLRRPTPMPPMSSGVVAPTPPPVPAPPTPTASRTTPQMHDWPGFGDLDKDKTLLEEKMQREPLDKVPPATPSLESPPPAAHASTSPDPYREPPE